MYVAGQLGIMDRTIPSCPVFSLRITKRSMGEAVRLVDAYLKLRVPAAT